MNHLFYSAVLRLCTSNFLFVIHGIQVVRTSSPPHIVFILADDLGWNDVSFHGSPEIPTPNIDALAASGIVLNNYYAAPICTPSRGSLMTGKYAIHIGLQHGVIQHGAPFGLPLSEKILPQYLKEFGYETHGIGKWHLGSHKRKFLPTNRGFDSFFGYWNGLMDYYDYTGYFKFDSDSPITEVWGLDLHDGETTARGYQGQYATDLFTEKALKVIESHNQSKPLFLYVSHLAPHVGNEYQPLQAPFDYVKKFNYIKNIKRRIHAGVVSKLDESVGKIFKGLHDAKMLKNTVLVFSSDNGASAEGYVFGGYGSNWPLRGLKGQLFEGGVKIPGLIWSPLLHLTEPRVSNQLMHISDWLPTLYTAAGGNVGNVRDIDGINMWDHLLHNVPSSRSEILLNVDPIFKESAMIEGNFKIILGITADGPNLWYAPPEHIDINIESLDEWVWKDGCTVKRILQENHMWLIRKPDAWRSDLTIKCHCQRHYSRSNDITQPQLFDLAEDPCEYNNLAEEHPKVLASLLVKLEMYNASAVKPLFKKMDPHSDPRCYNFVFVPWLDEEYKSDCPYL